MQVLTTFSCRLTNIYNLDSHFHSITKILLHVIRLYLCRHGETEPNAIQVLQGRGLDENVNNLFP